MIINKKLKHCILTNETGALPDKTLATIGFGQWINVFEGCILKTSDIMPELKDGVFDIIQIRLTKKNCKLISLVRKKIGADSKTKIVVCLDIPKEKWRKEFFWMPKLKKAVKSADMVYGVEYTISRKLEKLTGRKIYEIAHPADIDKLKTIKHPKKKGSLTILYKKGVYEYDKLIRCADPQNTRLLVVSKDKEKVVLPRYNTLETVYCTDEGSVIKTISESEALIIPNLYHNAGELVICGATQNCLVLTDILTDAGRRACPLSSIENGKPPGIMGYYHYYSNLKKDLSYVNFIKGYAADKVEYYSWGNMKKNLLDYLHDVTNDPRFIYYKQAQPGHKIRPGFFDQMNYLFGERNVDYGRDEFAVVCLVRDGMAHLPSFLEYYRKLGAKHFFFLDNMSKDNTPQYLEQFKDVTVYQTKLKHKTYESEMRATIIKEHCRGKWCMCVDIDEFFEYPSIDTVSMKQFLNYLNSNKYTAVVAHMLDLFSKELSFNTDGEEKDFFNQYCYYDNSHLKKELYFSFCSVFFNYNQLADNNMKYFTGGVREKYFDTGSDIYLLIKHPLLFLDHKTDPFTHPHYSNKVYVADISCLLRHFKFIPSFKKKVETLKDEYIFYTQKEYNTYLKALKDKDTFSLYSKDSKKLRNVDQLIDEGFITQSEQYKKYCQSVTADNIGVKFRVSSNSHN